MVFNASAPPDFLGDVAKSISMNVRRNHVTTAARVWICHKATDVNALLDIPELIAKKKNQIAVTIPAQKEPCARTSLVSTILLAYVDLVTQELIAISQ